MRLIHTRRDIFWCSTWMPCRGLSFLGHTEVWSCSCSCTPLLPSCFWECKYIVKYIWRYCKLCKTMHCVPLQASTPFFFFFFSLQSSYSKFCCDQECSKALPVTGGYCPKKVNHLTWQWFINKPDFTSIFLLKLLLSAKIMILTAISTVPSEKTTLSFVILKFCLWLRQ